MGSEQDIRGALGGSRLFDQPEHRAFVDVWRTFVTSDGPLLLEVGFDHGRRLTATAGQHPNWRVGGLEVRRQRVDEVVAWAAREGLANLMAWRVDARVALSKYTPDDSVDVLEVLFPTPWWDPGLRAKRLLLDAAFFATAARVLRPGGVLHLATDVPEYASWIEDLVGSQQALREDPSAQAHRPPIDQLSRREWLCARDAIPFRRWWLRCG